MTIIALPETMHAWVARAYGGPDVLELRHVPLPGLGPRDVLVRVEATTVSQADRRIRAMDFPRGLGWIGRAAFGFRRPRKAVLGVEATGVVTAVGREVTRYTVGDGVIAYRGASFGTHAEYLAMPESGPLVRRPPGMPLEMAAALGFGGLTARDYLRRAALARGERVLVIGAVGTVGSALVQLATHAGGVVTAVTSTGNIDLARSIGAVDVVDYTRVDITNLRPAFDIVADAVGALTFIKALPLLANGGRHLAINGSVGDMLALPKNGRRVIAGPAAERREDFEALVALAESGVFTPLVDSVFPFNEMPAAHARVDGGRKRGSVIVMVTRD